MPLTRPMPTGAKLVAAYIRQRVPRPQSFPVKYGKVQVLSFICAREDKDCCPLGLVPKAMCGFPTWVKDFRGGVPFSQEELIQFTKWWDDQEDAVQAVNAVWGDEDAIA